VHASYILGYFLTSGYLSCCRLQATDQATQKKLSKLSTAPNGNPSQRLWARERHRLYEITQCYLPSDTGERAPPQP